MSKIFGGSKSKQQSTSQATSVQSSSNRAYEPVSTALSPLLGEAQQGMNAYNAFMSGDTSGFNTYKANTGYDLAESQGFQKILGNSAARGVFTSGATGKALQRYGTDLQQQYAGSYLDRLLGRTKVGFEAANAITGAGNISSGSSQSSSQMTGESKGSNGLGKFLGQIGAGIAASDRRLKMNIVRVGELPNGLNVYTYEYINGMGPYTGVMADEVERIQPEALGPVIGGYATVDYSKIGGL